MEDKYSFESKIIPYISELDKDDKYNSSKIEVSSAIVEKFPYDIYDHRPIIFRISKGAIDFYVSFGGIFDNGDISGIGVKIPRWCLNPFNDDIFKLKPFENITFEHVTHIKNILFIHIFPVSIEFRRLLPSEEDQLVLLQNKIKNYLVLQTGTQISIYDDNLDMSFEFLIGDMYDENGYQVMVGKTLDCDISIDLQYPTDPEFLAEQEKKEKERIKDDEGKMLELRKRGKLFGFSKYRKTTDKTSYLQERNPSKLVFESGHGRTLE